MSRQEINDTRLAHSRLSGECQFIANRYANETVGDPAYPFNLFCRPITVSLETMKIVRNLPALDILA